MTGLVSASLPLSRIARLLRPHPRLLHPVVGRRMILVVRIFESVCQHDRRPVFPELVHRLHYVLPVCEPSDNRPCRKRGPGCLGSGRRGPIRPADFFDHPLPLHARDLPFRFPTLPIGTPNDPHRWPRAAYEAAAEPARHPTLAPWAPSTTTVGSFRSAIL